MGYSQANPDFRQLNKLHAVYQSCIDAKLTSFLETKSFGSHD